MYNKNSFIPKWELVVLSGRDILVPLVWIIIYRFAVSQNALIL